MAACRPSGWASKFASWTHRSGKCSRHARGPRGLPRPHDRPPTKRGGRSPAPLFHCYSGASRRSSSTSRRRTKKDKNNKCPLPPPPLIRKPRPLPKMPSPRLRNLRQPRRDSASTRQQNSTCSTFPSPPSSWNLGCPLAAAQWSMAGVAQARRGWPLASPTSSRPEALSSAGERRSLAESSTSTAR